MERSDAELIQRILEGEQEAFSPLVRKYQKGVHALVWRKIGDFHIAQEITQDAFLKAYRKLRSLKNHDRFAGWLYVIAANLCRDWCRENRLPMESLDRLDSNEVDKVSYSRYISEKWATETDEERREIIKSLLQKLPESERTVMTLHYLGEMTIKAISEFLGVSQNTIKSRLNRARNRLRKEEDMIQQNLSSFQLPAQLTENIMEEVSRTTVAMPTQGKPVLPWIFSAASAVFVLLLMGVGTQYLSRFQRPYDLDATSERTVEIIDAVMVLDSSAKPAVRNQTGTASRPGKNIGAGQKPNSPLFAAAPVDPAEVATPTSQWIETNGPAGGLISMFFATTNGDVYAGTTTHLYKLAAGGHTWKRLITGNAASLSSLDWLVGGNQMASRNNTIYVTADTEVLSSTDGGETWHSLGVRPEGQPIGIVVTQKKGQPETGVTLNLGLYDGIFRSEDGGKSWRSLIVGALTGRQIHAIAAVGNILFAGTDAGLYRLKSERWEKLNIPSASGSELAIHALAVDEYRLYVAAGNLFPNQTGVRLKIPGTADVPWWSLYRSTDQGDTWYTINPWEAPEPENNNAQPRFQVHFAPTPPPGMSEVKIVAKAGRVMVTDTYGATFYSLNTGETWTALDTKRWLGYNLASPVMMIDANTFYKGGPAGIQRTIDAGASWHSFNAGLVATSVNTLIAVDGRLYANSVDGFLTSVDDGESWEALPGDLDHGLFIEKFDGNLYVKRGNRMNEPSPLCRLSPEDGTLEFIADMPPLEKADPDAHKKVDEIMQKAVENQGKQDPENVDFEALQESLDVAFEELAATGMTSFFGDFAVSGDTYYAEYEKRLFRWKPGMTEWYDTGLKDEGDNFFASLFSSVFDSSTKVSTAQDVLDSKGFKLAASGRIVYVGKQDGKLYQSFDEGNTWKDVTSALPFSVKKFKEIVFAASTVYVATDRGVAYSRDGDHWELASDAEGTPLVMERLTVDGTNVYGQSGQYVYLLKSASGTWKQVTPEIPSPVSALAVDANTLYVGTLNSGVLRFPLPQPF